MKEINFSRAYAALLLALPGHLLAAAETQPPAQPATQNVKSEALAGVGTEALPPMPFVFTTRPGRFEIGSVSEAAARAGLAQAEEVWRTLEGPLLLPAGDFPSPVSVWLFPAAQWTGEAPFVSAAELGGRVSVRVRWSDDEAGRAALRRALVQALLMRRATSLHGGVPGLVVPPWLENAGVAWSLTHGNAGALDAWQRESLRTTPPSLATVLAQRRGSLAAHADEQSALWLLTHLQAESGEERRWPQLLRAVFGGTDTAAALWQFFGNYFKDDTERELWWQVGWHTQLRQAAQAGDTAAETRAWLAENARWTARRAAGGDDEPLAPDEVFAARARPWVTEELARRLARIRAGLATVHPFYRNAALSLGRLHEAALAGESNKFAQAQSDLARDIADGRELEQTATAALDELEAGRAAGGK